MKKSVIFPLAAQMRKKAWRGRAFSLVKKGAAIIIKVYFITRAKARMEGTMNTNRSVRVKDIVEKFQMEVINKGTDYDTEILTITDVNRPGLQFIGFFDYFDPRRLQIIGKSEVTFLRGYSAEERRKRFEDLFCYEIPALVISRNLDVFLSASRWRKSTAARCFARSTRPSSSPP